MRLGVVSLMLFVAVMIVGFASLLPAYFVAQTKLDALTVQASLIEQSLEQRDAGMSIGAVRSANLKLAALQVHNDEVNIEELVRAVLASKPANISLFSLQFETRDDEAELLLEGRASDRDTLLSFRRALEGESRFVSVKLPISDLAQTRDIDFSLKLELADML